MGLFDGFPFSNMHQLNLDWILKVCKKAEESVNTLDEKAERAEHSALDSASSATSSANFATLAEESAERSRFYAETFRTDTSLTEAGISADSKAVGEALALKAPAGFGLGGATEVVEHWDNATESGFYASASGLPDSADGSMHQGVVSRYNGWIYQDVKKTGTNESYALTRKKVENGDWKPWEWVNPPMISGVEYRTTERWNGAPVYVKMVDFGELPNTSTKVKESLLPTNITAISATGYAKTATTSKIITGSEVLIEVNNDVGHIICATKSNLSGHNGYIAVKYIKN